MDIPRVDPERCDGCGECLLACCVEAITLEEGKASIGEDCIACLACVQMCSHEAIVEPDLGVGRRRRLPGPMRPAPVRLPTEYAVLWPSRRR